MYLKRLQLHGFKSFANKTSLDFAPGITGIVGPNGSGKSNVADSLRWVLGEQSMRHLRGKKSEDVIFAGGRGRAAQGMAEVTLTLDNASAWLPSEFSEVTVTRRAFRSGESDYFVNGAKVRLKDVLSLLSQARIGHDSYTIIGQGLVDQALSARAEERRGLFEDAAGIRHFQVQRNEAEQRLGQTKDNLSRLHDILSEIEPRLGPLAEQARRAMDYVTARSELDRLLRRWYGHQWMTTQANLARAEAAEAATQGAQTALQTEIAASEEEQARHRLARETLLRVLGDLRRQRGETLAKIQGLDRDLAVARERSSSLERAGADLGGEEAQMRQQVADAEAQVVHFTAELEAADAELAGARDAIARREGTLHRAKQEQERESARLRAAQRDLMQAQAKLTASQSELTRLRKQREDRQTRLAAHQASATAAMERAREAQDRLDTLRAANEAERAELGDQLIARETLQHTLAETQAELDQGRAELGEAQREGRSLSDRLGLLREWASHAQTGAAFLAELEAMPADERPAILGDLAQLARIASDLEPALEAALGPALHALVAASEDDAWRAADLARAGGSPGPILIAWPVGEAGGAADPRDLAAQLDSATPLAVRAVVRTLIGAMRVAHPTTPADLRWDLDGVPLVTGGGEVAHPAGWLRIGQAVAATGESDLARARELRDLPERIAVAQERARLYEGLVTNARAAAEDQRTELQTLEKAIKIRENRLAEGSKILGQAQREAEKLNGEAQIQRAVEGQLTTEILTLEDEIAAAEERYGEAHAAQRDLTETLDTTQEETEAAERVFRQEQEDLARRRTELAVRQGETKGIEQRIAIARDQAREIATQAARRSERMHDIQRQRADVAAAIERYGVELGGYRAKAHEVTVELQAREAEAAEHDRRLAELDTTLAAARVTITQREGDSRRALLDAQRARDALTTLRDQMTEEMEAHDLAAIIERGQVDESDPIPPDEAPKMRRQIDTLRGRLKSLGGYDPEAPRIYEELKVRYEFLSGQVRDMEEASARLRAVIMELDATMRKRFEETFHAVNERFQRHFVTLFNGGAARLELTAPKRPAKGDEDDEDALNSPPEIGVNKRGMTGGIEVIVQIPGKRVQDLTLLSGGERAMVSAALLFALLETNPPPFCLLDEVDAALDEANVVRFCAILKTLADQTQFIVITHNRVTMTHAATLYGVSMAESVSRILSMRMAEERSA